MGLYSRKILYSISLAIVVVVSLLIWALIEEHKNWRAFSEEHSCKVTGKISGDTAFTTGFGMMQDGKFGPVFGTTRTRARTGYLCDDGVTYWR